MSSASRAILYASVVVLFAGSLASCKNANVHFPDEKDNSEIIGTTGNQSDSNVNAEIFLDATTSMAGFEAGSDHVYGTFLKELESGIRSNFRQSQIDFYKFGTVVRQIDRDTAILHRDANFYHEPGVFENTNLERVLSDVDGRKVRIILTDLFQSEGDVNRVVAAFKEKCFAQGIDVAILLVPADFVGKVFDANVPPYTYSSRPGVTTTFRPFYAIFVGRSDQFDKIFAALKVSAIGAHVAKENFVVLPKALVSRYDVKLTKKKGSKNVVLRRWPGATQPSNAFLADFTPSSEAEPLTISLTLSPTPFLPPRRNDQIKIDASVVIPTGKPLKPSKPESTADITLVSASGAGDNITVQLACQPSVPATTASYRIYFRLDPLEGFSVPASFIENSTTNPTPASDANKTLNLEKFLNDLIHSYASVNSRNLAKAYISLNLIK